MFIRSDKNISYARIFNASPDAPPVNVYINGSPTFENLSFKEFTEYIPLAKGSYKMEVYSTVNTDTMILEQDIEIPENEVITVVVVRYN